MAGEKSFWWKGGKRKHWAGYIYIYSPAHPYCGKRRQVAEHRLVMEKKIKRYLLPNEEIHHKNGIKTDNRIENLLLLTSIEHARLHSLTRKFWKNAPGHIGTAKRDEFGRFIRKN